jgi:hypothetical protein
MLALTQTELHAALSRGREILGAGSVATPASEPKESTSRAVGDHLVDAKALAAITGLPVSRLAAGARTGAIPSVKIGRYVRFNPAKVLAHLETQGAARLTNPTRTAETTPPVLPSPRRFKVAR